MNTPEENKPIASEAGHFYQKDGTPCYQVPNKSKPGTFRKTTITDARKLNLLPGVTTITRQLHSEALMKWRINEAAAALMTSPRREGEDEGAFIERVLWTDREHDAVAKAARDLGTDIHAAVEQALKGEPWDQDLKAYVDPALATISKLGTPLEMEKVVVGQGYAGKIDLLIKSASSERLTLVDFKTAKNPPARPYKEQILQRSAYAQAAMEMGFPVEHVCNLYVSTTEPGLVVLSELDSDWENAYSGGFAPLVKYWQWANNYTP